MPILHDDPRQAVKYNRQRGREVQRHRRPTPPASRPAPARRPTAVQRALAQEHQYASQGRAIAHQAHVQRVTRHKTEARQRRIERAAEKRNPTVFGRNALKTRQRSQREAIQALADYHAANPQEYDRKIREANKSRFRRNLDKVSGSAEHLIHKGTNAARDVLDKSQGGNQRRLQSAGLAPDPTKLADEALDIVANTPTSAYIAGAAGVEAVKGHPRRAGKLWKDFKETSALAP